MRKGHFAVAGAAIVVGSAPAAAAYADPNGCPSDFTTAPGTGTDFDVEPRLWPTGNECVAQTRSLDMGPGLVESLAFIGFAALLLTLAARRPTTLLRGASGCPSSRWSAAGEDPPAGAAQALERDVREGARDDAGDDTGLTTG